MKKALAAVASVVVLVILVRALIGALASDETKIRWLIEDTAEAFNRPTLGGVMRGFASDYRERTMDMDRQSLRAALAYAFTQKLDRKTRRFVYRVDVPEDDEVEVEVREDGTATARFRVRLREGRGEDAKLAWEAKVEAELKDTDDGWLFVRSTHESVSGARPGR